MERPVNAAKVYLMRYRGLVAQRDCLRRTIDEAYDRAYRCTTRLSPVRVSGSSGYDRMAEDVARISEEKEQLEAAEGKIKAALSEILEAISAVPDETQKAVLMMRYIEGAKWEEISNRLHYEDRQTFVLHGRALYAVNQWLKTMQ